MNNANYPYIIAAAAMGGLNMPEIIPGPSPIRSNTSRQARRKTIARLRAARGGGRLSRREASSRRRRR